MPPCPQITQTGVVFGLVSRSRKAASSSSRAVKSGGAEGSCRGATVLAAPSSAGSECRIASYVRRRSGPGSMPSSSISARRPCW